MDAILTVAVGLMAVAIAVAIVARRVRLPYTVGLVAVGMVIAFAHAGGAVVLTHDFIFDVILPPLLFEAAINIHARELLRDAVPVVTLAVLGTVISAAVVAAGMVWGLGWPVQAAALFGILIAATDPVAVIAMFKDTGVTGRLRLLTESEALFNDGVAAVLFTLALGWTEVASGGQGVAGFAVQTLLVTVAGGIVAGFVCAGAALAVAGQTADHLVESTLTTVTAYGSFLLAEHFHCSGVLATITAGLMIGNYGVLADDQRSRMSEQGREFALSLWEFFAFFANSLVFLLIGMTVARIPISQVGAAIFGIIALVLVARAMAVYPVCLLFARSRRAVSWGEQHILWWGGLRGPLGMALALSLPASMEYRNEILVATFGVVSFSVIAQGLSIPFFLKRLGFI
jgi:CPA1 family monovalent cation:H+ antiporter